MALESNSEDILYRLACECEDLFEQLQKALPRAKPKASDIEQCTEFQQRFSIWAAYLGVFAQKSQCLDTRLRNFPDLQDLATRLLDILRCSLHQYKDEISDQERDLASTDSDEYQYEAHSRPSESLAAIDNTLARLNRLGVTIRQSGQDKMHVRAEKSTAHLDLTTFTYFCANTVQTLYPNAHQHLKDHLKESMINRYKKMMHHNSRYFKLRAPREPHTKLYSIQEVPNSDLQTNIPVIQQAEAVPATVNRFRANVPTAPSQTDLSSASTKFHQTSSVQVSQGNYPRLPMTNTNGGIFACEWCSEPLDKKILSESQWRRHIDRDLEPYICLSEECQDTHPAYSTFDEWYSHMGRHNPRWYQKIYPSSTWVCTICEFNPGVYSNPQALNSHLQESHHKTFTNEQLHVLSQQSKIKQSRAWDNCLLCGFKVEKEDDKDTTGFFKRPKEELKQEAFKSARTTYSMTHPGHNNSDDSDFSDTSSDMDMNSLRQRQQQTEGRSKPVARHIAAHLQVLMLLTLRFAALQKDNEKLVDDDLNSDYVDVDDENSSPKGNDPENLSGIDSGRDDVTMEDMDDEDDLGVNKHVVNDLVEDDILIPDTDLGLDDIPRKYDGLVAENDVFLGNVIESGAWQSWKDEDLGVTKLVDNDLVKDDILAPGTDLGLDDISKKYDGSVAEKDVFLKDAFLKNVIECGAWQSWQDETKEPIRYDSKDYAVAWICTTGTEYVAAQAFLDEVHKEADICSKY
ncbi:hypothetical protein ACQKWADRAFT_321286 [Trichoderma austrokoningii]